jgi:hypothetical protein
MGFRAPGPPFNEAVAVRGWDVPRSLPNFPIPELSGNESGVPVTSIVISGVNEADFTEKNTCGSSIPVGSSCGVTVTSIPSALGARSAIVTVNDVAGTPITQTITLMGVGT